MQRELVGSRQLTRSYRIKLCLFFPGILLQNLFLGNFLQTLRFRRLWNVVEGAQLRQTQLVVQEALDLHPLPGLLGLLPQLIDRDLRILEFTLDVFVVGREVVSWVRGVCGRAHLFRLLPAIAEAPVHHYFTLEGLM